MSDLEDTFLQSLIGKLPALDYSWPEHIQILWWDCVEQIILSIKKVRKEIAAVDRKRDAEWLDEFGPRVTALTVPASGALKP